MNRDLVMKKINNSIVKIIDDVTLDNFTRVRKIEALLDKGADPNYTFSSRKNSLLMYAVYKDNLEIAKLLLSYGADPSIKDVDKETCLTLAKSLEMVELLLSLGVDINAKNSRGKTALLNFSEKAAMDKLNEKSYLEVVEVLLRNGANIKQVDNKNNSPFDFAERYKNKELLGLLEKYCKVA